MKTRTAVLLLVALWFACVLAYGCHRARQVVREIAKDSPKVEVSFLVSFDGTNYAQLPRPVSVQAAPLPTNAPVSVFMITTKGGF